MNRNNHKDNEMHLLSETGKMNQVTLTPSSSIMNKNENKNENTGETGSTPMPEKKTSATGDKRIYNIETIHAGQTPVVNMISPGLSRIISLPESQTSSPQNSARPSGKTAFPPNFSFDDLSSLSTVMSHELTSLIASTKDEGILLRKLERQNKRQFASKKFRFNVAIVGEDNCGKTLLREKMMENWSLLTVKHLPVGNEYLYQLTENSRFFQVSFLVARPGELLVQHTEVKINEYIEKFKTVGLLHSGTQLENIVDERIHLCVWVFPADEIYWRLNPVELKIEEEEIPTSSDYYSNPEYSKLIENIRTGQNFNKPGLLYNHSNIQQKDPTTNYAGGVVSNPTQVLLALQRSKEKQQENMHQIKEDEKENPEEYNNKNIKENPDNPNNTTNDTSFDLLNESSINRMDDSFDSHKKITGESGLVRINRTQSDNKFNKIDEDKTIFQKEPYPASIFSTLFGGSDTTSIQANYATSDDGCKRMSGTIDSNDINITVSGRNSPKIAITPVPASPRFSIEETIHYMKRMTQLVCLVPILSKTDTVPKEMHKLRDELRSILKEQHVKIFNGWLPASESDNDCNGTKVSPIREENEEDLQSTIIKQSDSKKSSEDYSISNSNKRAQKPLIRGPDIAPYRLVRTGSKSPKYQENPTQNDENSSSQVLMTPGLINKMMNKANDKEAKFNSLTDKKDEDMVTNNNRNSGRSVSLESSAYYEPLSIELIEKLRSQVLTCPLCVDCVLSYEDQDIEYNLPRFEGYPPMSPDFLRLVLIEGCSLLIMDFTSHLFASYYEKRERQIRKRKQIESVHNIVMSGLMFAAASAAFFLNNRNK